MRFVGLDLGTQSVKAVVCDERFAVLGDHQVAIATELPRSGWAEQDPGRWESAAEGAIAGALAASRTDGAAVSAMAVAGQLDGCVAVDARGAPLHRALIWQDRRATAHASLVAPARLHAVTGQIADPSHMAAKIRWLRAQGITAARYHQPVSYLVARWTGAAVLDPAHASTTMLYDLAAGTWSRELCDAFAIDPAELPEIRPTCAIAGPLARPVGCVLAGVPVAVGTGDDFATPLGAGIAAPGKIACVLGTAEVVGTVSTARVLDVPAARTGAKGGGDPAGSAGGAGVLPRGIDPWQALAEPMVETHAYPTGAFFVENPGWLSGGAVRWATRLLGLGGDAELDAAAAAAPPGAGGVTFVPALAGAMTPVWRPHARGTLHGLASAHDRGHAARAVLEGLAFAARDVVERLGALGLATERVLLLGGGSRSDVWAQLRADVLGLPHDAAASTDTCPIGAAMIAAVAAGVHPDLAAAAALAPPPARSFAPDPRARGAVDAAYRRYRTLVDHLAPLSVAPWAPGPDIS